MSTTAVKEATTAGAPDHEIVTRLREERFQARKAILDADPNIESRRRYWFLDRTLLDNKGMSTLLGVNAARLAVLKTEEDSEFPPADGYKEEEDTVAGVPSPLVEAGALRAWAELYMDRLTDLETGDLLRVQGRHGRPRKDNRSMSKRRKDS